MYYIVGVFRRRYIFTNFTDLLLYVNILLFANTVSPIRCGQYKNAIRKILFMKYANASDSRKNFTREINPLYSILYRIIVYFSGQHLLQVSGVECSTSGQSVKQCTLDELMVLANSLPHAQPVHDTVWFVESLSVRL